LKKLHRLGILPGGFKQYVTTLQKCLEYIQQNNLTQQQLVQWFLRTFPSSERIARDFVFTIRDLRLIVESAGKFCLSEIAKSFLETRDKRTLYQQLDTNFIGIHDIITLLYKQPLTLDEICSYLRVTYETKWQKATQCRIRIYWLRGLGYVIKDGRKYTLATEGKSLVESVSEEKPPTHKEIQDIIVQLGDVLNHWTKKEYSVDGYSLDVVWKKIETGVPSDVFEIQLRGNLHEAFSKLKQAYDKWNSKPFLVTTSENKLKAESLARSSFHEIENIVHVKTFKEVLEWYNSVKQASNITVKMGYKGIVVKRWRKTVPKKEQLITDNHCQ